MKGVFDW